VNAPVERIPFLDLAALHAEVTPALAEAVAPVLATSRFIGGPFVEAFEQQWADFCGARHAIGVANGTDALELALRGLEIGPGDEVLVPANTFVATPEAVLAAGAVPVFVDVDEHTLLIDLADAAAAITDRTAAVIPVHLYGQPVDPVAVVDFARRHGLAVIEDAAQAHGAVAADGRRAGTFGDAACFSFYPGKNLGAAGDGGAVVTDDEMLAERIRSIADHGRSPVSKYIHDVVGMNSRLDGLQAAVLSVKLPFLEDWNDRRRLAASLLDEALRGSGAEPVTMADDVRSARHLYVVRTEDREGLAGDLGRLGVDTGIHYALPCHLQPAFSRWADRPLPVAELAATRILSLPMSPTLTRSQVERVVAAVLELRPSTSMAGSRG
jgi:dTDP-3-amino-3,4,6-trideoxy-alpha-D-glucose transaminase